MVEALRRRDPQQVRARDLVAIAAVALLLRTAWVVVFGRTTPGLNDALFYVVAAEGFANDEGLKALPGQPSAHWPPGFPFLVSLAYRVFGIHPELGLAINVVLSTATAVLLYLVAERMLGRRAGLVAGATFAVLPGPLFFTGLFLSETTFMFMLVGFVALALFLPERRWTPVVLGIAAGVAALTKGEGVLLAVIPVAMWWGHHRRAVVVRRGAVVLAAMALTILPWTIRNAIVMDAFIPVSTNASTTLWSGHNGKATGGVVYPPASLYEDLPGRHDPQRAEVAEARMLRREAINWAIRNPHRELALIPRKLIALGGATSSVFPIWFKTGEKPEIGASSVFGVLGDAFDYALILLSLASLALVGPRRLWRIHPGMQAVLAYLALCLITYGFVYYGQFRYRIPMEPLMILVATPLLVGARRRRRPLRRSAAQPA